MSGYKLGFNFKFKTNFAYSGVQRITMAGLTAQLKQPLLQRQKHVHYLSKPLLFCIVLVMMIVGLCVWTGKLCEYIHEGENIHRHHLINVPCDNYPKEEKTKPRKLKDKNQSSKNPLKSFQTIPNGSDQDSLNKPTIGQVLKKPTGSHVTAADQERLKTGQ